MGSLLYGDVSMMLKKIRKLPEDFCMNLGWKIIKEREHLHYANVCCIHKVCKV